MSETDIAVTVNTISIRPPMREGIINRSKLTLFSGSAIEVHQPCNSAHVLPPTFICNKMMVPVIPRASDILKSQSREQLHEFGKSKQVVDLRGHCVKPTMSQILP